MKLFRIPEAADILGVSRATMYRLLSEKKIRHVTVNKSCKRIREDDLERYIESQTSTVMIKDEHGKYKRFQYVPGMKIV